MTDSFRVELLSFAQKDLKGLWAIREKVVETLLELVTDPEKGHELQQNLQGINALEFSVKGSGQYRAAYLILEEEKVCSVLAIGPHENFYDLVAKRVKKIKTLVEKVRAAKREKAESKKKK